MLPLKNVALTTSYIDVCRAWSEESSSSQPTAFSCCRLVRASLLADTRKNRYHARSIASRWLAGWRGRKKLKCLFIFSNSAAVTVTHDDFQVMPSVTYFIQSGLAKGSRTPYLSVNIPSEKLLVFRLIKESIKRLATHVKSYLVIC